MLSTWLLLVASIAAVSADSHEISFPKCTIKVQAYSPQDGDLTTSGFIEIQNSHRIKTWNPIAASTDVGKFYLALFTPDCKLKDGVVDLYSGSGATTAEIVDALTTVDNDDYKEGAYVVLVSKNGASSQLDFGSVASDAGVQAAGFFVNGVFESQGEEAAAWGGTGISGTNDVPISILIRKVGFPGLSIYKFAGPSYGPRLVTANFGTAEPQCPQPLPTINLFREDAFGIDNTKGVMQTDDGGETWARIVLDDPLCDGSVKGFEFYPFDEAALFQADIWRMKADGTEFTLELTTPKITPDAAHIAAAKPQYYCLSTPYTVTKDMRYGLHYPEAMHTLPGIHRAHVYPKMQESARYPCSEVPSPMTANTVLAWKQPVNDSATLNQDSTVRNLQVSDKVTYDPTTVEVTTAWPTLGTETRKNLQTLGIRPIMDTDFVYTCGCVEDKDCQQHGDGNMVCTTGACHCRADHSYNRRFNRCTGHVAVGAPAVSSTKNESAGAVTDANTGATVDDSTCLITNPESKPWLVIDMGMEKAVHGVTLRTPKTLDQSAYAVREVTAGDNEEIQYLTERSNTITLASVDKLVLNGPWPWHIADGSNIEVLNREMNVGPTTYESTSFGSVSTNIADATRLDFIGSFKSTTSEACIVANAVDTDITMETGVPCTIFYIFGSSANGYSIHKLQNGDNAIEAIDEGSSVQVKAASTVTYQFKVQLADAAPFLKRSQLEGHAGFIIVPANFDSARCFASAGTAGSTVTIETSSCHTFTLVPPSVLNTDAGSFPKFSEYSTVSTTSTSRDVSVSYAEADIAVVPPPCLDVAYADFFQSPIKPQGGVIMDIEESSTVVTAYIDGTKVYRPPNPETNRVLQTAAALPGGSGMLVRAAATGMRGFKVGVGAAFDGKSFEPADFELCASYPARPMAGEDHPISCNKMLYGQYLAIWIDSSPTNNRIELCDVKIQALPGRSATQNCMVDADCTLDENTHCNNVTNVCECNRGYRFWADAQLCVDHNECLRAEDNKCMAPNASLAGQEDGRCINMLGGYMCECPRGMMWDRMGDGGCVDINETLHNNCGCEDRCENRFVDEGGEPFQCYCDSPFYQLAENKRSCEDKNECDTPSWCGSGGVCVNLVGGFRCECPPGYELDASKRNCVDKNECASMDQAGCEGRCINKVTVVDGKPYECSCDNLGPGYKLAPDMHGCIDRNECVDGPNRCLQGTNNTYNESDPMEYVQGWCVNHMNYSDCMCPRGYRWNDTAMLCQDRDECMAGMHECEHMCTNTLGSYSCSCRPGWKLLENNHSCGDINECDPAEMSPMVCDDAPPGTMGVVGANCVNTIGSYRCMCPRGYHWNMANHWCDNVNECQDGMNGGCQDKCQDLLIDSDGATHVCMCDSRPGMKLANDRRTCIDLNECAEPASAPRRHNCDAGTTDLPDSGERYVQGECSNLYGSFVCSCPRGYMWNATVCEDVDECARDKPPCEHTCTNTNGGFTCSCEVGFELMEDGRGCQDVDECAASPSPCSQRCMNELGSYQCICDRGYVLDADKTTCNDIDDCQVNNGGCQQVCTNGAGRPTCSCNQGYDLNADNRTCSDVDECADDTTCPQTCDNTMGSYRCGCNPGYELDADMKTCNNVNECQLAYANGGCEHACLDSPGSFTCTCPPGYTLGLNGRACQDVNECLPGGGATCDQLCVNTPGGYLCVCDGNTRIDADNPNHCIAGRLIRMTLCLDTFSYLPELSDINDPKAQALAANMETAIKNEMGANSAAARDGNYDYQISRFRPCADNKIGAEIVAIPNSEVTDAQMATFASDLSSVLPVKPDLISVPAAVTGTGSAATVGLQSDPAFFYVDSTGTNEFRVSSPCAYFDNMKLCKNDGFCVIDDGIPSCTCASEWSGPACSEQALPGGFSRVEIGLIAAFAGLGVIMLIMAVCLCCYLVNRANKPPPSPPSYSGGGGGGSGYGGDFTNARFGNNWQTMDSLYGYKM